MQSPIRIVITIATVLTVLVCLGFGIWGLIIHQILLAIVCALLVLPFAVMAYSDYKYFTNKG